MLSNAMGGASGGCFPSHPTSIAFCLAVSPPFQLVNAFYSSCLGINDQGFLSYQACNAEDENQMIRFRFTNDARNQIQITIGSVPRLCLSHGSSPLRETPLSLEDCVVQNSNLLWTYPEASSPDYGLIKSGPYPNLCVGNPRNDDGGRFRLYGCYRDLDLMAFHQRGKPLITPS